MRMRPPKAFSLFVLLLLTNRWIAAQDYTKATLVYNQFLPTWEKALATEDVAGASWALFTQDTLLATGAFGKSTAKSGRPASWQDTYQIGSLSKLFTATLALQAIADGKWRLGMLWPTLLPDVPLASPVEGISLRHLLAHQSGLPTDIYQGAFSERPIDMTTIRTQLAQTYTIVPAGTMTVYSNIAYTVIGLGLAQSYQQDFLSLLQQKLISPLQLTHTFGQQDSNRVYGFTRKGKRQPEPYIRDLPAGGLLSNIPDLVRFSQAWMRHTILPVSLRNEAWSVQNSSLPKDLEHQQGLSWQIDTWQACGNIYWHSGATRYHRAILLIAPALKLGFVALSNNTKGAAVFPLAFSLLDEIGRQYGKQGRQSNNQWSTDALVASPVDKVTAQWAGLYEMPGYTFTVDESKNGYSVTLPDMTFRLIHIGNNLYMPVRKKWGLLPIKEQAVLFSFQPIAGQLVMLRHHLQGRTQLFGYKVTDTAPPLPAWLARKGKYVVASALPSEIEDFKDFQLLVEDNRLYLSLHNAIIPQTFRFIVHAINEDKAAVGPIGRSGGDILTAEDQPDGTTVLHVYGYTLVQQ